MMQDGQDDNGTSKAVSNSEFLAALVGPNASRVSAPGSVLWTANFIGDPGKAGGNWHGNIFNAATLASGVADTWVRFNTYFSVASLVPDQATGEYARKIVNFGRLLALVTDDAKIENLQGRPTYILQTSPGKYQVGVLLLADDPDCANLGLVSLLVGQLAGNGLMGVDRSGNNIVRYVRLPVGTNHKPRESGPFQHQMMVWNPDQEMSLADAAAMYGIDLDALRPHAEGERMRLMGLAYAREDLESAPSDRVPQERDTVDGHAAKIRRLTYDIVSGSSLHDPTRDLAASMIATGMAPGAALTLLRALMDSSLAPRDERWHDRYRDIPRAIKQAELKFKPAQTRVLPPAPGQGPSLEQQGPERDFSQLNAGRAGPAADLQTGSAAAAAPVQAETGPAPMWDAPSPVVAAEKKDEQLLVPLSSSINEVTKMDWLINDFIERKSLVMLYGPHSSGKSFLAIDWAMSVGLGREWQNKKVKQGISIYIAGEGFQGIKRRFKAYVVKNGIDGSLFHQVFISRKSVSFLDADAAMDAAQHIDDVIVQVAAALGKTVNEVQVEMVVIDTLNRNFGDGDENSSQDMTVFVEHVDTYICKRFGTAVVIVHHTGHDSDRGRGSSVLPAAMDQIFWVKPTGLGQLTLICKKMKEGELAPDVSLAIEQVILVPETDTEDAITGAVLIRPGDQLDYQLLPGKGDTPPVTARGLVDIILKFPGEGTEFWADQLGVPKRTLQRAIGIAIDQSIVIREGSGPGTTYKLTPQTVIEASKGGAFTDLPTSSKPIAKGDQAIDMPDGTRSS